MLWSSVFIKRLIKNKSDWYSKIEETGWLQIISTILSSSKSAVDSIKNGKVVLIHCSDGWDRTPQLICLTEILIDPYYRTIEVLFQQGFIVLIEKDFLSFGHQFNKRFAHGIM